MSGRRTPACRRIARDRRARYDAPHNSNKQAEEETRTPAELLEIIEQKGRWGGGCGGAEGDYVIRRTIRAMTEASENPKPSWFPRLERVDPKSISADRPVYHTISAAKVLRLASEGKLSALELEGLERLFPIWQHGDRWVS